MPSRLPLYDSKGMYVIRFKPTYYKTTQSAFTRVLELLIVVLPTKFKFRLLNWSKKEVVKSSTKKIAATPFWILLQMKFYFSTSNCTLGRLLFWS